MQRSKNRFSILTLLLLVVQSGLFAQYGEPLRIPLHLSANFGELRNNHFHSGIDFKTQQVINKPVYAVADGYISRISVSAGGYGNAIYIDHPEHGQTSVYGHLDSFSKQIADYVEEKQYENESFSVNLYLEAHKIPITKGEQIALSGNRGSSGGPHLHFEIRETKTQNPVDPLQYIAKSIIDSQKPDIRGIAFYPVSGQGVINGEAAPTRLTIYKSKAGNPLPLQKKIMAWGIIGVGVKAYDKMNGQANIYGVKHIRLFVDDEQVFSSSINEYSFSETRMLNSFIDFEDWRDNKSFYMKSFIEPGNKLDFYESINNGYINIREERMYQMKYELEDHFGNTTTYEFSVQGIFQEIPKSPKCENFMAWKLQNKYVDYDFMLTIPEDNLYDNFCFTHSHTSDATNDYYSDIHQVNNTPVPLHNTGKMWIKLKSDTLLQRNKYGIVKLNRTNNRDSWMGGKYGHGGVELNINELGDRYAISIDTIAPKIVPLNPQTWKQNGRIRIRLSDDKSGISFFRGTIDGQFVLFEHDSKSTIYTYIFNRERLGELPIKNFQFIARDGVGNETMYEYLLN
ncbi:MAG: M23 family metallopeptidase [Dysgonamonadaceae bacterium]|nr:M23 family metallopeptidase [Dysgonamonadaceae bacterium]MDD3356000.1 M23 family metallopeptidase [Dysgonamonadaceae bacterium]MDD3727562.1 M23 family metallopeptidase [Dysgonamonadaceae bacterium]MDD4605444.1 M23 family metallopeptidase [Dysgonamonadaceae bacterium]